MDEVPLPADIIQKFANKVNSIVSPFLPLPRVTSGSNCIMCGERRPALWPACECAGGRLI